MDSYEFLAEQVERIEAPKREHERLKSAVVEAAQEWQMHQFKWDAPGYVMMLDEAVKALNVFEAEHSASPKER